MAKRAPTPKLFVPLYYSSILTITTLCLIMMPSQIHSSTLEADTLSLREIKRAIDPNSVTPSSYLNSWDFTMDPCESTGSQFLGILCDLPLDNNSSSRVTAIDLDGIGYEGFLSPNTSHWEPHRAYTTQPEQQQVQRTNTRNHCKTKKTNQTHPIRKLLHWCNPTRSNWTQEASISRCFLEQAFRLNP